MFNQSAASSSMSPGIASPPRGAGPLSPGHQLDEAQRHVFTPPSHFFVGGVATTSGPTSTGDGCARYLRQQARDREDARLREQARWKNRSATPRSPGAYQEERQLAIDPSLSLPFHPSGEAPGAAVSLAATPSPDQRFPGVTALPATPSSINWALDPCAGRLACST